MHSENISPWTKLVTLFGSCGAPYSRVIMHYRVVATGWLLLPLVATCVRRIALLTH